MLENVPVQGRELSEVYERQQAETERPLDAS
jgi:hypothetical protein